MDIAREYNRDMTDAVWSEFVNELQDSVYFKDGAVHFIIPTEIPGEYTLTSDLYCGYIDEKTGKEMNYYANIEWDNEDLQDWVPGGDYSFTIDGLQFKHIGFNLRVEGRFYFIDMEHVLPEENVFN